MEYACILSGGSGLRLWPKSRKAFPKQFLKLFGDKSFLEMTYDRIKKILPQDRIFIVTHINYRSHLKLLLPQVKDENLVFEPEQKETLACIALVCMHVLKKDPDSILGVFPSDHFISNIEKFESAMKKGYELAKKDHIVCFGILPTRAETNYGYIKRGKKIGEGLFLTERFIEKPDSKKAKYLIKSGYLWNSGIYIFKVSTFLRELKRYMPHYYDIFMRIFSAISNENYIEELKKGYKLLEKVSVDKAIMEKTKKLVVCISEFEWDDVGTWSAFERILRKDENGNVIKTEAIVSESKNCIIFSDKFVMALGIKDIILVSVEDAILICHKSKEREIKDIIQGIALNEKYKRFL
ncbi:Mannose-1-phosphate guanylyltransferase (GDP) [Caldicellulosiruptor saccharolyticus DSM 8903]|uniref:mannose-1-phosphate guanylyltransferase n=1 Tax=Caldicellulosiruptor saccharolyticus (strain ATCC 43494 / DSM 8903 / Tp8T 6331) TaxID=351627 RepID=A4XG88_CALS8|nr:MULTISPECIES: mannose-1-phosphate guanylyltransferase [Caldicellulosiruptor]ABP65923.1 Mannose-1-phosphate guanylyltransferase (GDP) [Caldicellulosiruptor saccharolyticus DSM 8903]